MKKYHEIEDISFDEQSMSLKIDGKKYNYKLADISARLSAASLSARLHFELSASGYGIHWPELDEDLSIDGLLGVKHEIPAVAHAL